MGRRKGFGKTRAKKLPPFELIDHNMKPLPEPYRLLAEIRKAHHPDLKEAKIVLAWQKGIKADKDGHVMLGKCIKIGDLQKELADWDFVITLNFDVWQSSEWTREKKMALLDHELMHAAESLDKDGEPKVDAKGRRQWRIRKHDVEEFSAIIERHGIWKRDLERFAEAIMKTKQKTLEFPAPVATVSGEATIQ
jgi:hypothetical protein